MNSSLFMKFFLSSIFLSFSLSSTAQIETVESLSNFHLPPNNHFDLSKKIGNHFIFGRLGEYNPFWKLDLNSGTVSTLLPENRHTRQEKFSTAGIFYLEEPSSNGSPYHLLHYVDTLGNEMQAVEVNYYTSLSQGHFRPYHGTMCDNHYYVEGFINNMHCVWESDGTNSGTHVIYQSNDRIVDIEALNDTLFFATDDGLNQQLFFYVLGQSPVQFSNASSANFSYRYPVIGKNNTHFFFAAKDENNNHIIYRQNFSNPPEPFIHGNGSDLQFEANSFRLNLSNGIDSSGLFTGSLSNPSSLERIPYSSSIDVPSIQINRQYGNGYYGSLSLDHGLEIVRINSQDSIEMIQTNAPFAKSGIPFHLDGYTYPYFYFEQKFCTDENDVSYAVLTNGLDTNFYVYRLNDPVEEALFRVDNPEIMSNLFTHNNFLYWLELDRVMSELTIKRRDLSLPYDQPLATIDSDSNTWFRQFVMSYFNSIIYSDDITPSLHGVQFDQDNNAYFGFTINQWGSNMNYVDADTNLRYAFKGSNVYAKYDAQGNILWANGIGARNGLFFTNNGFTLKPNGNLVVMGHFSTRAYFDSDSLNAFAVGFFLAELDANTGNVLWKKKLADKPYLNDIYLDGLETDEEGNIYLSFMYKNFQLNLNGILLNSEKNQSNGLAKFDPNGQIIWAKNIDTPWLDYAGRTRSMDYSEAFHTLTTVQSMGYYNVSSSCEYHEFDYYIQEFDKQGNILSKHELTGSDIGSITVGTRTSDNRYFANGYFRGTLSMDHFTASTAPYQNCHRTEGFGLIYDGDSEKIIKAMTTNNAAFFPLDIAKTNENIYVYGTDEEYELTLLKYSSEGRFLAYKKLNQFTDPFGWPKENNYFDITHDYIIIAGTNFRRDPNFDIRPLANALPSISLLKIENSDWIPKDNWIQALNVELENEHDFLVYPNPFSDEIEILFGGKEVPYTHFKLVDAMGRLIQTGEFNDVQHQTIQVNGLRSGMYIITLSNDSEHSSQQIIKL